MSNDKLTRIAIVDSDRCKPKKCRQECKKSCPVVKMVSASLNLGTGMQEKGLARYHETDFMVHFPLRMTGQALYRSGSCIKGDFQTFFMYHAVRSPGAMGHLTNLLSVPLWCNRLLSYQNNSV